MSKTVSASVLRNIVSSILKINTREVILSGVIPENTIFPNWGGYNYDSRYESTKLYYFNPEQGLKEFALCQSEYDSGTTLREISNSEELEKSLFLVVIREGFNYDNHSSVTLYKSPDFKEIFTKYEQEEIARWEQWIG